MLANDAGFKAVKTAAKVRNEVLESVGGLIPIFSDVELFLVTFNGDGNILNASLDLAVTTLAAIEGAIGFFIKNERKSRLPSLCAECKERQGPRLTGYHGKVLKTGNALFSGEDYEATLVKSLGMIRAKSRRLMGEALKSHIHESHIANICTYGLGRSASSSHFHGPPADTVHNSSPIRLPRDAKNSYLLATHAENRGRWSQQHQRLSYRALDRDVSNESRAVSNESSTIRERP